MKYLTLYIPFIKFMGGLPPYVNDETEKTCCQSSPVSHAQHFDWCGGWSMFHFVCCLQQNFIETLSGSPVDSQVRPVTMHCGTPCQCRFLHSNVTIAIVCYIPVPPGRSACTCPAPGMINLFIFLCSSS